MSLEVTQDTGILAILVVLVMGQMRRINKLCKDVANLKGRHEND